MNKIYEPKEDSFLLANKIQNMKSVKTLEVGIGSGLVTNELIKISKIVIGTDISYDVLLEYKKSPNNINSIDLVCCINCDVFRHNVFDLIVFNPPYLSSHDIVDLAVDGGIDGIQITVEILETIYPILKINGEILFVSSSFSNYVKIINLLEKQGFQVKIVDKYHVFFEDIILIHAKNNVINTIY